MRRRASPPVPGQNAREDVVRHAINAIEAQRLIAVENELGDLVVSSQLIERAGLPAAAGAGCL